MQEHKPRPRKRLQRVSVRAEHRKEPDWDRFAWAVLQHARLIAKQAKEPAGRSASKKQ